MKLTHKLCAAALVAAAGVALTLPSTTKAAEDNKKTGDAHIGFTFDTSGTSNVIPTDPGVTDGTTITNIPSVTNPGLFGMIAVTPLEFNNHDVLTASKTRDYYANLFLANPGSTTKGTEEFKVQNFVKFQDLRTLETHQYSLSAAMTTQFNSGGVQLKGATITYSNTNVTSTADAELKPAAPTATVQLTEDGASKTFIDNAGTAGKGYGQFELNFGDKTTGDKSVLLNIPTTTAIGVGDYNAVITWTLASTL